MTSARDIDVVVFDILWTMVDEPGGIRRGVRALPAGVDDARTDELVAMWQAHVDDQQRQMLTGHRPYAASTVVDLEAAARVAEAAGVTGDGTVATGTSPERLLMVAAHAWDLRGAQAIGMRTAYVERPVGDPPGPTDAFDVAAPSLDEPATTLGCP